MKRLAFFLLCLVCAAGGVALGRYAWAAPLEDAPVTGPVDSALPGKAPSQSVPSTLAALRSGPRRAALLVSLSAHGDRRHLPALIEACAHDHVALRFLADLWLESDPAAFVRALSTAKAMQGLDRDQCAEVLRSVLERWGRKAPDEAWHAAERLPDTLRRMALSNLVAKRLEADPRAGLEFLRAHPDVSPGYLTATPGKDYASLLPLIQSLPESPAKGNLLREAIKDMPLAEALQAVRHSGDMVEAMARRAAMVQAAKRSLDEVVAFHATATGTERFQAAHVISDHLLKKDPAAAVTWAQEHLSGDIRTSVIKKAAEHLESKDPATAEAARALLPESVRETAQ